MTYYTLNYLGITILTAYVCFFHLVADETGQLFASTSLRYPNDNSQENLFYSLDDSVENVQSKCDTEINCIQPENFQAEPDQLFYPNLFSNQPALQTTTSQPNAEVLSTPVKKTAVEQTQVQKTPVISTPVTQTPLAPVQSTAVPVQETPVIPEVVTPTPLPTPTAIPPTLSPTPTAPATPQALPPAIPNTGHSTAPVNLNVTVPTTANPQQALQQSPIFPSPTQAPAPAIVPSATQTQAASTINNINTQPPGVAPAAAAATASTTQIKGTGQPIDAQKTILINFNNVAITEYIRFISRISNKNFVFDENDLQFTVTIVSEEPTTIDNIMTALLQELRIHDLELIEQDNTIIIHRNSKVSSISKVVTEDQNMSDIQNVDIVTKVFRLNTLEADRAAIILKPMVSATALVEVLKQTNHLIITDLSSNVREISALLKSLDSPQSGLVIGQYVARTQPMESLIAIAARIIEPIALDQKVTFIPHRTANSIFIVSNPYLVERTISILKYLDQPAASTQILNPKDLNFLQGQAPGQWVLDKNGNWQFIPGPSLHGKNPPRGNWKVDDQGNWFFEEGDPIPGNKGPDGKWVLDKDGNWVFQLKAGKSISPERLQRKGSFSAELPVGHIERTQFFIYKLQYRKGEQIARALGRIADSLAVSSGGTTNGDLLAAIYSVQWIESSNSLIFTGTNDAIVKLKELIADIDVPLRQVLLEMLIIETDIIDSLNFSTNVAANFGGGNTSGAEAFLSGASTLPGGMATTGIGQTPNAAPQATSLTGFVLGIIGQTITHNGTEFASLGALVKALTTRSITRIVMNPKVLTEDNSPAELFVGINTQFPTQSIANNFGTVVTQNFEFRDVGTTIKVTPIIGNNDVITLEIQEEVSSVVSGGVTSGQTTSVTGPTTKVNRTTTKVHVPNRFFLILSGMLNDQDERNRTQVPCLGSVPILGAAFSDKQVKDTKQNLMIFIHPIIIDTEEEIDNITRHEQNVWRVKNRRPKEWVWETEEAMDFFNIIDTENSDGDEDCY